jgi:large subunit ribosomal protein L15
MLDRLTPRPGSRRPKKRVGRGIGSGNGRTCGRGQKGAGARAGHKRLLRLEGGQTPLVRRLPKVGFNNRFRDPAQIVNVKELNRFEAGTVVDGESLAGAGLVRRGDRPVKILGEGDVGVSLTVKVHAVSAAARKKLEAAGGTIEVPPARRPAKRGGKAE